MAIFGYTQRALRAKAGLTIEELAEKTGVSIHLLQGIESGYIEPTEEAAARIAAFFDVTTAYMRGSARVTVVQTDGTHLEAPPIAPDGYVRIGVVPFTALAQQMISESDYVSDIVLPLPQRTGSYDEYIALRVVDDTLKACRIQKGDTLIVHIQPIAENGDIVVVKMPNGAHVLRRYFRTGSMVCLVGDSEDVEPIEYPLADKDHALFGVVVQVIIYLKTPTL